MTRLFSFSLLCLQAALEAVTFGQLLPMISCSQASVTGDFFNPTYGQGFFVSKVSDGVGEPLNVIISAKSSREYFQDNASFVRYANALSFGKECLGIHLGTPQTANLDDGRGWVNQTMELRKKLPIFGTCSESLFGGNHLRMWRQETSNALFLAVSLEGGLSEHHKISPNGYDLGRESLVEAAVGNKEYGDTRYYTTAYNITGCIKPGSEGINHNIATDGIITVLQVEIM